MSHSAKKNIAGLESQSNYKEEISQDLKDDIKIAFEIYQDDSST